MRKERNAKSIPKNYFIFHSILQWHSNLRWKNYTFEHKTIKCGRILSSLRTLTRIFSVRPKVRPSLFLIECTLRTNRYFFESRHSYFIKSPYCFPRDNKRRKLGPYHIFVFVDKQQTAAWFCRSDDRSKNLFPIANSLRKDSPIGAVVFDFFFPSNFFRF